MVAKGLLEQRPILLVEVYESFTNTVIQLRRLYLIGAGTGPAGPAMAGPFSTEVET